MLAASCDGTPARTQTAVGAVCKQDSDCYNTAKKQLCAATPENDGAAATDQTRICTRPCQDRTGCPLGFECVWSGAQKQKVCLSCLDNTDCPLGTACLTAPAGADGGAAMIPAKTCQAVPAVQKGDFGKDCAVSGDTACNVAGGFFCHGEVTDDPEAYCTRTCKTDSDCVPNMFCGTTSDTNVPNGKTHRCFLRGQCAACRDDSECNAANSLCIPDSFGKGYCTRMCNGDDKMPCTAQTASRGYLDCVDAPRDLSKPDQTVSVCAPRYGRCHAEGAVCDPCRAHHPEDCQKVSGRGCVQTQRGEGLCQQACSKSDDCGDNSNLDPSTSLICIAVGPDHYCSASRSDITCWP